MARRLRGRSGDLVASVGAGENVEPALSRASIASRHEWRPVAGHIVAARTDHRRQLIRHRVLTHVRTRLRSPCMSLLSLFRTRSAAETETVRRCARACVGMLERVPSSSASRYNYTITISLHQISRSDPDKTTRNVDRSWRGNDDTGFGRRDRRPVHNIRNLCNRE